VCRNRCESCENSSKPLRPMLMRFSLIPTFSYQENFWHLKCGGAWRKILVLVFINGGCVEIVAIRRTCPPWTRRCDSRDSFENIWGKCGRIVGAELASARIPDPMKMWATARVAPTTGGGCRKRCDSCDSFENIWGKCGRIVGAELASARIPDPMKMRATARVAPTTGGVCRKRCDPKDVPTLDTTLRFLRIMRKYMGKMRPNCRGRACLCPYP